MIPGRNASNSRPHAIRVKFCVNASSSPCILGPCEPIYASTRDGNRKRTCAHSARAARTVERRVGLRRCPRLGRHAVHVRRPQRKRCGHTDGRFGHRRRCYRARGGGGGVGGSELQRVIVRSTATTKPRARQQAGGGGGRLVDGSRLRPRT